MLVYNITVSCHKKIYKSSWTWVGLLVAYLEEDWAINDIFKQGFQQLLKHDLLTSFVSSQEETVESYLRM